MPHQLWRANIVTNGGSLAVAAEKWEQVKGDDEPFTALLTGLDNAGKTTLRYSAPPYGDPGLYYVGGAIGWNIEKDAIGGLSIIEWDLGGMDKLRPLYRHYYPRFDAVIFMVDATDHERLLQAACELHALLNERELMAAEDFPVLILVNKLELPDALPLEEIAEALRLEAFEKGMAPAWCGTYHIHLQGCSIRATTGKARSKDVEVPGELPAELRDGLQRGFDWLAAMLPGLEPPVFTLAQ